MNVSPVFTVVLAPFLVLTNSGGLYLAPAENYADESGESEPEQ